MGPVAFAIHNFYAAMLEVAVETDHPKWYQPPDITCVERASGFSAMRSQLWEMAYSATRGDWPRNSDGTPDSPQAVVFLTSIVDVTVGY